MRAMLTIESGRGDTAKIVTIPTALSREDLAHMAIGGDGRVASDNLRQWLKDIERVLNETAAPKLEAPELEPAATAALELEAPDSVNEVGDAGPLDNA